MRALVQRVAMAQVAVAGETVGAIGPGLLILVCTMAGDSDDAAPKLAAKSRMNRSLIDTGGGALGGSQVTLAADTSRGNRPGFSAAAAPAEGERLYLAFVEALRGLGVPVATGRFGAEMAVSLTNDGPVTIWLDNAPG